MTNEAVFEKDLQNKTVTATRKFDAALPLVWRAWTEADILDQWWAPKPYRAVTQSMDFREGGMWLYAMTGPEGDRQMCRVDFKSINPKKGFSNTATFCDEQGNINEEFPMMYWTLTFTEANGTTTVRVEMRFDEVEGLEKVMGMGMQEGFTMALGNLDEYLAANK